MSRLELRQVDVFASAPLSGNGLAVVITETRLDPMFMQRLTCELRQFETIFLVPTATPSSYEARVFTMEEELPFAGHPVLGAACVLHERLYYVGDAEERAEWTLELPVGPVQVSTIRREGWYEATMDQGQPQFGATLDAEMVSQMLAALNLEESDLYPGLPLEVVSTGLPYLLAPLASGLERAAIVRPGFEALLASVGAKFVYVLHLPTREGRTWDNDGRVEDVATGSAAGPVGAYLVRHGLAAAGAEITLQQGRFLGRPSQMRVRVEGADGADGADGEIAAVYVTGDVRMVARGVFE